MKRKVFCFKSSFEIDMKNLVSKREVSDSIIIVKAETTEEKLRDGNTNA